MAQKLLKTFLSVFIAASFVICCCFNDAAAVEAPLAVAVSNPCPAGEKCCDAAAGGCLDIHQAATDVKGASGVQKFSQRKSSPYLGNGLVHGLSPLPAVTPDASLIRLNAASLPLFILHRNLRL